MDITNLKDKYYKRLDEFLKTTEEQMSLDYRISLIGELNARGMEAIEKEKMVLINKFNRYTDSFKKSLSKEKIDYLKNVITQKEEKLNNDLSVIIEAVPHEDFFSEIFDKHYYAISSYYFLAEGLKWLDCNVNNVIKTDGNIKNKIKEASINCINCYCSTLIKIHGEKEPKMIDYMPNLFFNWRSRESWWEDVLIYGAKKFFNFDTDKVVFYEENINSLDLSKIGPDYVKY